MSGPKALPKHATAKPVLLVDDEDDAEEQADTQVVQGINKYLEQRSMKSKQSLQERVTAVAPQEEEHTGITDDDDSDGEPDYDVVSRGSLKAKSDALMEIVREVQQLELEEQERSSRQSQGGSNQAAAPAATSSAAAGKAPAAAPEKRANSSTGSKARS